MKRSASDTIESPPDLRFVLDETLSGRSILQGLKERGIAVHSFQEFFQRGAKDTEVLQVLARQPGLFLITRDQDFRYKRDVAVEIRRRGAGVFVLSASGNRTGNQLAAILADAWPRIVRTTRRTRRPFVARIRGDGTVIV